MIRNYGFSLFPSASCVASLLALGLEDGVGNRLAVVDAYAALFFDSSNFFCGVTILLHDFLGVVADGFARITGGSPADSKRSGVIGRACLPNSSYSTVRRESLM